ncbi:MAG: glutamine synthetase family protein [Pseudomonadota bacterium]
MSFSENLAAFRSAHPAVETIELFMVDLNGIQRGKLVPVAALDKLAAGTMRMPCSSLALSIFGGDTEGVGLAIERGDPDGVLRPVAGSLAALPWAPGRGQIQVQVAELDGGPAPYDPREVLARVARRAAGIELSPVMALEIEFYLIDAERPCPPVNPVAGGRMESAQIYDMTTSAAFAPMIERICAAAHALGAPAEGAIAEFGPGQFEINLGHVSDALRAADHMVALKRAIRGVARSSGMDATFMPKPYGDMAGSGMHLHLSLKDREGQNVFSGEDETPNLAARHALSGMLGSMGDCMLIFAPSANAYRRLMPGSYAPIVAAWGTDNRGTALRMPEVSGKGARIEHRTGGAEANPYLLTAAVLAGALAGLEATMDPPPPVTGEAGAGDGEGLPLSWQQAIACFAQSEFVADWLGADLQRIYAEMKRQERGVLLSQVPETEYAAYLRTL